MSINQNEIINLFKNIPSNIQTLHLTKYYSKGSTLQFRIGSRSQTGIFLQDTASGDAIAFQTEQGNWYIQGNSTNLENRQDKRIITYSQIDPPQNEQYYFINTLLALDMSFITTPNKISEVYSVTGGNPKVKQIDVLTFSYDAEFIVFSPNDSFISNYGKNKRLITTKTYAASSTNYNNNLSQELYLQSIKVFKNNQLTTFQPKLYFNGNIATLFYLGNGIWQSAIECGLGQIIANTTKTLPGAFQLDVGIDITEKRYSGVYTFNSSGLQKQTAVILPEDKNLIIHDNILETFTGFISVENIDTSGYNILFGLRNKTIEHEVYLPNTEKETTNKFKYTAVRTGSSQQYQYTEKVEGELLGLHFNKCYITQKLNYTQTSTYLAKPKPPDAMTNYYFGQYGYSVNFSYTGTNEIILNTDNTKLTLNTTNKFLVVPFYNTSKTYSPSNLEQELVLTVATTSFFLKYVDKSSLYNNKVDYSLINSTIDMSVYTGEPILLPCVIDKQPYMIKGNIASAEYTRATAITLIGVNITEFVRLPSANPENILLPFYALILDNGCFWNYYLSQIEDIYNAIPNTKNPFLEWTEINWTYCNFNQLSPLISRQARFQVYCDQTVPIVHLSPISRFCVHHPYKQRTSKLNSDSILSTDNIVNNKIYRVCSTESLFSTDRLSNIIKYKKKPVAVWDILPNGDIKYNKTFLTDYALDYPKQIDTVNFNPYNINVLETGNIYCPA